jgi:hypothetical protein
VEPAIAVPPCFIVSFEVEHRRVRFSWCDFAAPPSSNAVEALWAARRVRLLLLLIRCFFGHRRQTNFRELL